MNIDERAHIKAHTLLASHVKHVSYKEGMYQV